MLRPVQRSAAEFICDLQQVRGFSDGARDMYLYAWRGLAKFSGRLDLDIDDETCGRFLRHLENLGRSAKYIHSVRASLQTIRNAAFECGLSAKPRIRPVRIPEVVPEAWSREEVSRLVAAARLLVGHYGARARCDWWTTAIEAAWHTGLRWKDQLRLERSQFAADGTAIIVQHKTGKSIAIAVPTQLLRKLPSRGKCWPWPFSYECFRATFSKIVAAADVPSGPWKRLRKSAGNAAEELMPGRGHEFLGNERRTFEKYYLVRDRKPIVRLPDVL